MPYSETCSPRRTAASRSCTLWALAPVKCCSTLPNWSGATTLRSTFRPAWVVARAPAGPDCCTVSTTGSCSSAATSAAVSSAVAITSRSLTASTWRRSEPATSTRCAPGALRSASAICWAMGSARESRIRGAGVPSAPAASASSSCCSTFSPKPRSLRTSWRSHAARSASSESIPSSSNSRRARLGPKPGRWVMAISPGGNFSRSLTACGISPVSSSATSLDSSVLPMPGISVTLPSRTICATETDDSRTAFAAVRYARTRYWTAPSSS